MKTRHAPTTFALTILLLVSLACVIPGMGGAQPAPAVNPNAIETAIYSTAQAALELTFTAAQAAATPLSAGMTGTTLEKSEDGTTKYTDHDAGFEVTYPAGWLSLRPKSEEFDAALSNEAAANSMLHDQMMADQTSYEDFDRLYSYILRPDLQENGLFGFSNLKWDPEDPATLDTVTMGNLVRGLESPNGIPGFRADVVQLHEEGDVKMIEIGGRWSMSDGQGGTVPFYSTVLFLKPTPDSTVRMTFTYLDEFHDQISADVRSIMAAIKLLQK